jgi:hypothetical protein
VNAALGAALLLAGCAATTEMGPPSPTPADFPGIAVKLAANGIVVEHVVSGDAGCTDRDLVPTAIGFTARGKDQPTPVPVHLYIFRNADSYQRLRAAVDACAASFVTDPAGYESLDADPYVLAGQGPWPTGFKEALRSSLLAASGAG